MNPLDALLAPPALVKRALDDLHDIANEIRAVRAGIELLDELLEGTQRAVAPLSSQIAHMEQQLDGLVAEMAPMRNLEPIRRGIEPLEKSMISVRESVDELEPMITDLDRKIRQIDPKLDEMQDSIEPIGDLAEKIPGNRRRRG